MMALWTKPENPLADVVQTGGHSMEMVCNITHRLFLQYEVGEHSLERVDFLTFENQYHPMEEPEETQERYRTNLKCRIQLMINMQHLAHSKYMKPLTGMWCHYMENAVEAQVIRGQSSELYEQLIRASTIILEETGMLLLMYDKALFSDAAYAAIMKASENITTARFLQIQQLKVWRCTFYFADTRWINQTRHGVNLEMIIADFDCCSEPVLQQMEANAWERLQRATGLTAWVHINVTALHQRNAEALRKQWVKAGQKIEKLELNDLPKLIQKMGKFDNTNMHSKFNLDRMVQMQNDAAE